MDMLVGLEPIYWGIGKQKIKYGSAHPVKLIEC
jgi:hypothetical protein